LNPLRPENAPDDWERKALEAFERGEQVKAELTKIKGEPYLRLMGPLITKEECLKCHGHQGCKVGDIRGGISISFPMTPLWAIARKHGIALVVGHSGLWLLGLLGVALGARSISRGAEERRRVRETLRFQARLLDNVRESVVATNLDGRVIYWGKGAKALYGYNVEEVMGKLVPSVVEPQEKERMRRIRETGMWSGQYMQRRRDGSSFWADTTISLVKDQNDQPIGLIGIDRDITDRIRAAEALRNSEEKYRSLTDEVLDSSAVGIFILDADFKILWINQAIERYFGFRREELVGKNNRQNIRERIKDILEDPDGFVEKVLATYDDNTYTERFECHVLPNGERKECWLEHRSQPIRSGLFAGGRIEHYYDITDRKLANDALRKSEASLALAQRIAHLGNWDWDIVKNELYWSDEIYRIFGLKPREFGATYEAFLDCVHPDDREFVEQSVNDVLYENKPYSIEHRIVLPDGTERIVQEQAEATFNEAGEAIRMVGTVQDITEHKHAEEEKNKLEEQLRQAQKLEAIGQLAGGIAHDFNNLLTAIQGYTDLAMAKVPQDSRIYHDLREVETAGRLATDLTWQLLAFSRKQPIQLEVMDLSRVIAGMSNLLRRLIREDIKLQTKLSPKLWRNMADAGQLEQVVVNLVVNARDAMPGGGRIILETENVELDEDYAREHLDTKPGRYVMLAVTDTGHGMSKDVREHIFEPFYTTKPEGAGTGLGLSTVYGIVKQHGGNISVYSEEGRGTTFRVYLPAVDTKEEIKRSTRRKTMPRGT
ncbi:MAG: PAS domain S-box protein, partial [Acidiferrobacterales bacterium]